MKSEEGPIRERIQENIEVIRSEHLEIPSEVEASLRRVEEWISRKGKGDWAHMPAAQPWTEWTLGQGLSLNLEHELHNLANDLYRTEWFDEAIVFYSLALNMRPGMLETHFNRALAYVRVNRYQEALDDLTAVIDLNENLAEAWYTRGLVYEYMEEFTVAIEQYDRALEVDPDYEKAATQREVARSKHARVSNSQHEDDDEREEASRRKRKEQAGDVIKALKAHSELESRIDAEQPTWRVAPERRKLFDFLGQYGRLLTTPTAPNKELHDVDDTLRSLVRTLSKRTRRSAVVVAPAGTGKSALVQELAYRIVRGHPSIPAGLRDIDIFELSPVFLQADTKYRGEYEDKIKELIQVLEVSPNVVVYVDEIHSFFRSNTDDAESGYNQAHESFKRVLANGSITFIGCTTPGEYRHFIEPDTALARRFSVVRVNPPTKGGTLEILKARRNKVEKHYPSVTISNEVLEKVVDLTEQLLPSRFQPDKSIQLVDEGCSYCITESPPLTELTEEVLVRALEDMTGRSFVTERTLTESYVLEQLRTKIIGQDDVLQSLARAVVAGLGEWKRTTGPRGVFLFGGPTGVGKTETALVLSEVIGGGRTVLLRVDCNTIQGSGHDSSSAIHRLLGVPRGLLGHVPGQGGVLSRVRDIPDAVVLFDEFEKADPGVSRLLLQIIDDGRVEDIDGNILDFRRSFIVFTTNAGSSYEPKKEIGLLPQTAELEQPKIEESELKRILRGSGVGEEFFGRLTHVFLFQGLGRSVIPAVIHRKLEELRDMAELRNMGLTWSDEVVDYLTREWQPCYGVRHLSTILKNRIIEQLNLADAQGELRDVADILLAVVDPSTEQETPSQRACAERRKVDSRLEILLS